MSYSLRIEDPDGNIMQSPVLISPFGSIYPVYGIRDLEASVTYNYWQQFRRAFVTEQGIYCLDGLSCLASIPLIRTAMDNLNDDVSNDYFEATDGNAKQALTQLLTLAALGCNGGIWRVH